MGQLEVTNGKFDDINGKFEDIDGKLRGQQWEIWRTLMGHFEAINGNNR